jgi:ABC-type lipoprotein export system ATPase subunit
MHFMEVVHIDRLKKTFTSGRSEQIVLDHLSFTASAGESYAIVGKSGSGKSTLLNIIAGLEDFDSGSATVFNQSLQYLSATKRDELRLKEMGIIFQFFHLLPTLSLWENAMLPASAAALDSQNLIRELEILFQKLELEKDSWKKFPHEVSGGMLGRAGVARALLKRPRLLLADEPTGNLDSATSKLVLDLLLEEVSNRKITLIMVTHDKEAAARCNKKFHLVEGRFNNPCDQT